MLNDRVLVRWRAVQVAVGWYFGASEPKELPKPILVGGHMGHHFGLCNFRRALVDGGPIQVAVTAPPPADVQRFGSSKCESGDSPGRWILMKDKPCAPPYCTGDRFKTVNDLDWVRASFQRSVVSFGSLKSDADVSVHCTT